MEEVFFSCEVWREIEGHQGYFVSNQERLRHNDKLLQGRILRGRRRVSFGRGTETDFHIVVAKAFPEICGTWFPGCHVHHIDFNKLNNKPENLKVLSEREHLQLHYQYQSDKFKKPSAEKSQAISKALSGKRAVHKHIPILQYSLDGELLKEWECISDVVSEGYRPGNVCWCCKGKLKTAYGFKWAYK